MTRPIRLEHLQACIDWWGGPEEDLTMPLNIPDPDTYTLAKRLASLTGESLTRAVKLAIQQRLAQVEKTQGTPRLADELDHIALHCAALPRRDRRGTEQIIGYDEQGLPV